MIFDRFATYAPLEVKFLHLQNHSHHQRGASRASNSQEGVWVLEYKNPVVMQAPLVIKKGKEEYRTYDGVEKQSFPKSMIFKKCHEVAFVEQAALLLALKQQLDLSTHT